MAADMVVRARSPPGMRLIMTASSPMTGRVSSARSGCTSRPRPALSTRVRVSDAGWVGQRETQGDRAAGGVADQVERWPGADGEEERGHEGCQVGTGSVTAGNGAALAVTGQAQRQYPVGPGEGGDDPPPAGRALLVPVQEEQRRSGAGFQILGFHPVDRDPTIMKNGLHPGLGLRRSRRGLREGSHGVSGYSLTRVSG